MGGGCMNQVIERNVEQIIDDQIQAQKIRIAHASSDPTVLSQIYDESCNIAIWQRNLDGRFLDEIAQFVEQGKHINIAKQLDAESFEHDLSALAIGEPFGAQLRTNIAELVDMFSYLFDAKTVGFRLSTLHKAMCPKFHVDRVPCRLVTAFHGSGSQWLEHDKVNRKILGHKGCMFRSKSIDHFGSIRSLISV
jgi:hypothetical protein